MILEFEDRVLHTVGKYPRVKTLRREVLPHAPSPMMTSFLLQAMVSNASDKAM